MKPAMCFWVEPRVSVSQDLGEIVCEMIKQLNKQRCCLKIYDIRLLRDIRGKITSESDTYIDLLLENSSLIDFPSL